MTDYEDLKEQARSMNALVMCPTDECEFSESFVNYLDRDDHVDQTDEIVHWECPECGREALNLGAPDGSGTPIPILTFNGIEEFEQTFAE